MKTENTPTVALIINKGDSYEINSDNSCVFYVYKSVFMRF